MGQDLNKIKRTYDTVAKEYSETFSGEHEKKPKDQEILHRFVQEIGNRSPVWDFGCGPGQTSKYLKDLGIGISGLDLSEKTVDIDIMFFSSDFIVSCLMSSGFKKIKVIEREPYREVEYESRRAYVFAIKPGNRQKV